MASLGVVDPPQPGTSIESYFRAVRRAFRGRHDIAAARAVLPRATQHGDIPGDDKGVQRDGSRRIVALSQRLAAVLDVRLNKRWPS